MCASMWMLRPVYVHVIVLQCKKYRLHKLDLSWLHTSIGLAWLLSDLATSELVP